MKNYSADKELKDILLKFGFIETTNIQDQSNEKKEFRISKNGQKRIHFDYINIRVGYRNQLHSLGTSVSADGIAIVLLFFFLKPNDNKELFNNSFSLEGAKDRLNSIKNEYKSLVEFNLHKPRREKLARIIEKSEELKDQLL